MLTKPPVDYADMRPNISGLLTMFKCSISIVSWVFNCESASTSTVQLREASLTALIARAVSVFQVFWHVSLHVEGEVVRPGETPLTHFAFEGLGSGVLPVMAGQLVRPGVR